jgi:hypothetical protein
LIISRERRVGVKKATTIDPCPYRSSFPLHPCSFFSPPCGQRRQTHMRSSFVSVRSLFGHVSIVIPPFFLYLSRIGNSFPKRVVLIRKKPSNPFKKSLPIDLRGCNVWSYITKLSNGDGGGGGSDPVIGAFLIAFLINPTVVVATARERNILL